MLNRIIHRYESPFYKEVWIRTNSYISHLNMITDLVVAAITNDNEFICTETEYKNEVLTFIRKEKLKKLKKI